MILLGYLYEVSIVICRISDGPDQLEPSKFDCTKHKVYLGLSLNNTAHHYVNQYTISRNKSLHSCSHGANRSGRHSLTRSLLSTILSSTDGLRKQFGPRSGPTKYRA